jgi:biotin carboxyl carrier protein
VSIPSSSAWRTPAALAALALLAVACGQTVSPQHGQGGPVAAAPDRPVATGDPEPEPALPDDPDAAEVDDADPGGEAGPTTGPEADAEPTAAPDPGEEPAREVADNAWTPFAAVEGVTLHHPSSRVERVGFHQANHDGARQLEVLDDAISPMTLESRERATGSRSAADVVVDPEVEIRAPVTGTVVRAGTYVLYCDHSDDFVVIEPDARPDWEVKLLHIDGVQVGEGQHVRAGGTVLAPRPTPLPFESQVDEHTAEPSWPHVHIEVVDPSIPNESSGGGC